MSTNSIITPRFDTDSETTCEESIVFSEPSAIPDLNDLDPLIQPVRRYNFLFPYTTAIEHVLTFHSRIQTSSLM